MPSPRRIGVFGGAFDPPHLAHIALARAAVSQLELDVLNILPTGHAWYKKRTLTAAEHRLAMVELAFADLPCTRIDTRELLHPSPTYTVDTLTQLQSENPGCQLFLILGADQARVLDQWHRWRDILQIAIISVAGRTNGMGVEAQNQPAAWMLQPHFEPLTLPPMTVSATEIRHKVAAGQGILGLVSEPIARYIAQHHLYQSP